MARNIDYEQMIEFVKDYFDSHNPIGTELSYRYPFRRRFDHCLRVMMWAYRIALAESTDLEITQISALFHDIGKSMDETKEGHGELGAQIVGDYLTSIAYDKTKTEKIIRIVHTHINRASESDASLEAKVVSDADLLDEIGAITVLWDTVACAGEEAPSYDKAFERITKAYEKLKVIMPDRIHTQTAKRILAERLSFMDIFLKNLEYELGRSEAVP